MTVGRFRWWLMQRLRLVMLPTGDRHESSPFPGTRAMRPLFVSPSRVGLEDHQDHRATIDQILAAGHGEARRVATIGGWAYYRVSEPLNGRTASGHWVTDGKGGMVLRAIKLVPENGYGYPLNRDWSVSPWIVAFAVVVVVGLLVLLVLDVRDRPRRACFHHEHATGESWVVGQLVDVGRRKLWRCTRCGQTWL